MDDLSSFMSLVFGATFQLSGWVDRVARTRQCGQCGQCGQTGGIEEPVFCPSTICYHLISYTDAHLLGLT